MKKSAGIFVLIFVASVLGVLAAFQIDRAMHAPNYSVNEEKDFPYNMPVSMSSQLPAGPPDFIAASKKIMPSVVSVDQQVTAYDLFSGRAETERAGTGSGVIISSDGLILTNNHVVAGADSLKVRVQDVPGSYTAKVIGADPKSDLAVIKIDAHNLVPAELGDSGRIQVGQWVLAVGNPLGYSNTVSAGVVSSLKRTLPESDSGPGLLIDAIQTDAAINPGNSGGALTNAQGQVIGINTLIASNTGGSVGLGFSIPINRAKRVVHDIVNYGHVRYGEPGLAIVDREIQDEDVQYQMSQRLGISPPSVGLVINQVDPNGPAAQAGIQPLDVVEAVDGQTMVQPIDFYKLFADKRPGDKVSMKIWDKGNTKDVSLTLSDVATY